MRIKLTFVEKMGGSILLPLHYNSCIQGMLYGSITSSLSSQLHDDGFPFKDRKFKLFTFSRIQQRGEYFFFNNQKYFIFRSGISFYLSSAVDNLLSDVLAQSMKKPVFRLNNHDLVLQEATIHSDPNFSSPMTIKMMSPMTTYTTFYTEEKEKRVHYYHPWSKDFPHFLQKNLLRKYAVIHQCDIPSIEEFPFSIEPLRVDKGRNFSVVLYKNNPIEAWTGIYKIQGSLQLIQISYSSGLGSKNSMGFGMWTPYHLPQESDKSLNDESDTV